jgi:hypothetical protein
MMVGQLDSWTVGFDRLPRVHTAHQSTGMYTTGINASCGGAHTAHATDGIRQSRHLDTPQNTSWWLISDKGRHVERHSNDRLDLALADL